MPWVFVCYYAEVSFKYCRSGVCDFSSAYHYRVKSLPKHGWHKFRLRRVCLKYFRAGGINPGVYVSERRFRYGGWKCSDGSDASGISGDDCEAA